MTDWSLLGGDPAPGDPSVLRWFAGRRVSALRPPDWWSRATGKLDGAAHNVAHDARRAGSWLAQDVETNGKMALDGAGLVGSAALTAVGGMGAGFGVGLDLTGVGALVGVPLDAAGVALAAAGVGGVGFFAGQLSHDLGKGAPPVTPATFMIREILKSGSDDWVSLDEIEGIALRSGAATGEEVRDRAKLAIDHLATAGLVEIGQVLRNEGFVRWDGPREELLARVAEILERPNENDRSYAMWLANTPEGNVRGEQYLREDGQINENYGKPREG